MATRFEKLVILIIIALLVSNLLVQVLLLMKINQLSADKPKTNSMYLPALPVSYVSENPECVNKLINAMNISNVRIKDNIDS